MDSCDSNQCYAAALKSGSIPWALHFSIGCVEKRAERTCRRSFTCQFHHLFFHHLFLCWGVAPQCAIANYLVLSGTKIFLIGWYLAYDLGVSCTDRWVHEVVAVLATNTYIDKALVPTHTTFTQIFAHFREVSANIGFETSNHSCSGNIPVKIYRMIA